MKTNNFNIIKLLIIAMALLGVTMIEPLITILLIFGFGLFHTEDYKEYKHYERGNEDEYDS
ncbi:MAG: hypothetical protein R3321_03725 [Nitrososphaeraceae archaeon]|nr:hypothetical protein [Nitrososphaeraceae archaeon]